MKRLLALGVAGAAATLGAVELLAWARMRREETDPARPRDVLYAEECGSGDPAVFIPGLQASTRYWGDVRPIAAAGRRVVLLDLLGFGRSPWPMHESYEIEDHLRWIRMTMIARNATRNVTLVAHSFGTIIAAHYAARFPSEIAHLYLLGAPLFDSPEEARERIWKMSSIAALFSLNRFLAREGCMVLCAFRPLMTRIAPLLRPDLPVAVAQDAMLHHWPSIRDAIDILLHLPLLPALSGTIGPKTTFVHGTDDTVTPLQRIRDSAMAIGASVLEVQGGHHSYGSQLPRLLTAEPGVRRP